MSKLYSEDKHLGISLSQDDVEKKYTRKQIIQVAPKTRTERKLIDVSSGDTLWNILNEFKEDGYDPEQVHIDIDYGLFDYEPTTVYVESVKTVILSEDERYYIGIRTRFNNEWERIRKNAIRRKNRQDERKEYERLKKKFEG